MYDYLELLNFNAWDVERTHQEIEDMRRKRHGMATLQPQSAGPESGRLHCAGDLRGPRDNACFARYDVTFAGNIELPEGATVAPIALAIAENGETLPSSVAIATPAAVEEAWNVVSLATIDVPRGCCLTISLRSVAADPVETPAPVITVLNGVLRIVRIA